VPIRDRVRTEVIGRDGGCVAEGIPGIPHGQIPGRATLEVNELQRGSGVRQRVYLDPDWCIALCPTAHDFVTTHYKEAEDAGLYLPSWVGPEGPELARERREQARR